MRRLARRFELDCEITVLPNAVSPESHNSVERNQCPEREAVGTAGCEPNAAKARDDAGYTPRTRVAVVVSNAAASRARVITVGVR